MARSIKKTVDIIFGLCDDCFLKSNRTNDKQLLVTNENVIAHNEVISKEPTRESVKEQTKEATKESIQKGLVNEITSDPIFEVSLETPELSLEVVIKNLTEISKLHEYQKLWLNNDILVIDNSWTPSITRWLYDQSKETIVPHISKTIKCGLIYVTLNYENTEIKNLLVSSVLGLKKLIVTYPSKKNEIEEIILKIEGNFSLFRVLETKKLKF